MSLSGQQRNLCFLRYSLFFTLFAIYPMMAEEGSRVWMDNEGRTLEAVLMEHGEESIRIRRISDNQEFTLPISRLSHRDRAWLEGRQKQEETDSPGRVNLAEFPQGGLVWPQRVSLPGELEVEVVREDNRERIYVYRTRHFEFISDTKLARRVVSQFAVVFEGTLEAMKALPLGWNPRVPEGGYQARLFGNRDDYFAAGGPEGSGGVYLPSRREILVPLSSLGVRGSSSGVTLDRRAGHGTLVHEVTHQVHHDWLGRLPVWLVEGMATYMESVPLERGEFRFHRMDPEQFVREAGNYSGDLPMVHPSRLMTISNEEWIRNLSWNVLDVGRHYHSAFLLTYYFAHLDGEGDGRRLWLYLRALEKGTPPDEALNILMDGRSYDELWDDIQRGFRGMRVRVRSF